MAEQPSPKPMDLDASQFKELTGFPNLYTEIGTVEISPGIETQIAISINFMVIYLFNCPDGKSYSYPMLEIFQTLSRQVVCEIEKEKNND